MASPCKQSPRSPREALRRRSRLDARLDPDLLRALAEPTRARLLSCLLKCGRACSVSEVAECCDIDFSMVARHLATLARAGIVDADKQGRTVWYTARAAHLSEHFRALADAIDELVPLTPCCDAPEVSGGRAKGAQP